MNAAKVLVKNYLEGELRKVKDVLASPYPEYLEAFNRGEAGWSKQGLGMLRKYICDDKKYRLHIWDRMLRNDGVTMMHDHPWDFTSEVIVGHVVNDRWLSIDSPDYPRSSKPAHPMMKQPIACGPGGGVCNPPTRVILVPGDRVHLYEGDTYVQQADEIHVSQPEDGSVTIIKRVFHENTEVANVYYPENGGFVSAEPAPASAAEVAAVLERSLGRWFN